MEFFFWTHVTRGTVLLLHTSADGCGCLHFFDEKFGGIEEMPYLCSVNE